jgi:uncharacterized protein HemX
VPKKSSSPKTKTGLILVIGLIVGLALAFGFVTWSRNQAVEKSQELVRNELQMGQLFIEVELSPAEIAKLADQKKIAEAIALGEEMQAKMDQVLELNQTLIDNTKGQPKELSLKKQEIFQVQKQILETMMRAVNLKDFKSAEAQAIQKELTDLGAEKQTLVEELQAIMTGE